MMLKENLRNRIIYAIMMTAGFCALCILAVLAWIPTDLKMVASQTIIGLGLVMGVSLFGLEEESEHST